MMKFQLALEEFAQLIAGILVFNFLDISWWWFLAFFLAPDIGMLGYVVSTTVGAFTYNLFHHKGIALGVLFLGYFLEIEWCMFAGIILFAHAAFDRILGYGLKYPDQFKNTHLTYLNEK